MRLSIIIPTLNEAENITATLDALQTLRKRGHELIVVDGGSRDNTIELSEPLADHVITSSSGRANQMNAGAKTASGEILWFVHADTLVPQDADQQIVSALTENRKWGRFNVSLSGRHLILRMVEAMMNLRSQVTGIATGDQGIFVDRNIFAWVNGYPDIPLMEDIALSKKLKQLSRPICLRTRLITSSRRWEQHGILRTILLMWRLRLAYFLGASPISLARRY